MMRTTRLMLSRVLGCFLLAALPWMPVQAAPSLGLTTFDAGAGLQGIDVVATDVTDLYAYQFSLSFNPAFLEATSVTEGGFLPSGGATFFDSGVIDNASGTISFVFGTLLSPVAGVTGSGVLVSLLFNTLQDGVNRLTLSDVIALNSNLDDIPVEVGGLTLVPEPGSLWLLAAAVLIAVGGQRLGRAKPQLGV